MCSYSQNSFQWFSGDQNALPLTLSPSYPLASAALSFALQPERIRCSWNLPPLRYHSLPWTSSNRAFDKCRSKSAMLRRNEDFASSVVIGSEITHMQNSLLSKPASKYET